MNFEQTRLIASSTLIRNLPGFRFACYAAFLILSCCVGPNARGFVYAQHSVPDSVESEWLTGKNRERNNPFAVSVSWNEAPLKARLEQFSKHQKVAIFVDRRVDPRHLISLQQKGVTVEQFIWAAAESCDLGACLIGDVYYFGPKESAAALPVMVAQLEKSLSRLPKATRSSWLKKSQVAWPNLTEPDAILKELESKNSIKMPSLPHDLWTETSLPPLTLAESMSLILVGFEKAIQIGETGAAIELIDFRADVSGKVSLHSASVSKSLLKEIRKQFPSGKFSIKGTKLSAAGSASQIAATTAMLVAAQEPEKRTGTDSFSMKAEATRLAILQNVATQTGRKLEFSADLESALSGRVALDQEEATLVELLMATVDGTGLSIEVNDEVIRVVR